MIMVRYRLVFDCQEYRPRHPSPHSLPTTILFEDVATYLSVLSAKAYLLWDPRMSKYCLFDCPLRCVQ